jgi:predicted transcriptional regulator
MLLCLNLFEVLAMVEDQSLSTHVLRILKEANYGVFENLYSELEMCFEILARNDTDKRSPKLLIKIVDNIDTIKKHVFNELKLLSQLTKSIPLIVGMKNRHSLLEDDGIYLRQDIITVNLHTFSTIIRSPKIPLALAFAKQGGLFYNVDGTKLTQLREKHGISRKILADRLKITSKAISQYERKGMRTSKEHAKKLESILGDSIIEPLDISKFLSNSLKPFQLDPDLQKKIAKKSREFAKSIDEIVQDTGFQTFWTRTTPFDLLIYRENEGEKDGFEYTFVGGAQNEKYITDLKHDAQAKFIHEVSQHDSAIIIDEEIYSEYNKVAEQTKIPTLIPKDLKQLEDPEEFKKLLKRKKRTLN